MFSTLLNEMFEKQLKQLSEQNAVIMKLKKEIEDSKQNKDKVNESFSSLLKSNKDAFIKVETLEEENRILKHENEKLSKGLQSANEIIEALNAKLSKLEDKFETFYDTVVELSNEIYDNQ